MIPYTLIRTRRRSLSIQISSEGGLIARAPMRMRIAFIEDFIAIKRDWIQKHQTKRINTIQKPLLTHTDIEIAKKKLMTYIIPRITELGVGKNLPKITSIKITKSERRWGSCSARNGLCFSYRLAEHLSLSSGGTKDLPGDTSEKETNSSQTQNDNSKFIDAIIIHELAHLIEKNHQKPFWNLVSSWMPEYETVMKNRENIE